MKWILIIFFIIILSYFITLIPSPTVEIESINSNYISMKEGSNPDATVTIVEFVDFDCPFCKEMHQTLTELQKDIEFNHVIRNYPATKIHPNSFDAAILYECTLDSKTLFQTQGKSRIHRGVSCQITEEEETLISKRIMDHMIEGQSAGVRGTPTIFINGRKIEGKIPKEKLYRLILDQTQRI